MNTIRKKIFNALAAADKFLSRVPFRGIITLGFGSMAGLAQLKDKTLLAYVLLGAGLFIGLGGIDFRQKRNGEGKSK